MNKYQTDSTENSFLYPSLLRPIYVALQPALSNVLKTVQKNVFSS